MRPFYFIAALAGACLVLALVVAPTLRLSTASAFEPTATPSALSTPAGAPQRMGDCITGSDAAWCAPLVAAATPIPSIVKIPEGNAHNVNPSIPAANLWLCLAPSPCSGAGEGNLRVVERASGVQTADQNGDSVPDGLGAYEFNVTYDNFVIQSINPCDIVFGPTGAGASRGPVDEVDGLNNPDCSPDPGAASPGTCAPSFILENLVHFGCTTSGAAAGPVGAMDLASLNLIPHPDLANDLFPGNDNGIVTVLKDTGCELVDTFGHAVQGSVNGGLTPICGDLAVTVRILEGDLDLDCKVTVADEQDLAVRYGAFFGSLLYNKYFDLEPATHDLDIDIKDLQKVFGRDGSSCQNPLPSQPPAVPPAAFGG